MRPLSLDLRRRILDALNDEGSSRVVAARFKVSASGVRKLRAKVERTGILEPDVAPGRERLVRGKHERQLKKLLTQYPDATLNLLRELLADKTGLAVSETTMWRQLRRMGLTLKKRASAPPSESERT